MGNELRYFQRFSVLMHAVGDQSTREQGYTIFYVDAQSEEQLQAAVDAIREKISPLEPKDGETQRFFEIPDSKVSEVLGPQGVALTRIKERSGARLEIKAVPPAEYHGSTRGMPRTVNCVGTEGAVNKCEELVNKVVAGTVTCADLISEYEVDHPEVRSQKRLSSTPSYDETKRRRMDYDDHQGGGFDNSYNAGYQRGGGFGGSRVGGPIKGGGEGAWNDNSAAAAADFCILEVPFNGVGAIIGRGGEVINRLKEDSRCDIQISKSGAGPYREVSLQGPHDGIITVVGFINERLAGAHVVKAAPANGLPPYLFGSGDGAPRGRMGSGGPQPYMQQQGPPSTARSYGMQGGPPEAHSTPPGQPWQQPQIEGYSAGNSMMPQYQQQPPPYAGGPCGGYYSQQYGGCLLQRQQPAQGYMTPQQSPVPAGGPSPPAQAARGQGASGESSSAYGSAYGLAAAWQQYYASLHRQQAATSRPPQ